MILVCRICREVEDYLEIFGSEVYRHFESKESY